MRDYILDAFMVLTQEKDDALRGICCGLHWGLSVPSIAQLVSTGVQTVFCQCPLGIQWWTAVSTWYPAMSTGVQMVSYRCPLATSYSIPWCSLVSSGVQCTEAFLCINFFFILVLMLLPTSTPVHSLSLSYSSSVVSSAPPSCAPPLLLFVALCTSTERAPQGSESVRVRL